MKIIQHFFLFIILFLSTASNVIFGQQQKLLLAQRPLAESPLSQSLNLAHLPEQIKKEQTRRFVNLASSSAVRFKIYGNPDYGICNVDQKRMINHIALRATQDDHEFYILDIGAGDGSFGKSIYRYVNSGEFKDFLETKRILKNVRFHIVSVTAEPMGSTIQIGENGIHYYVTKFMAENLSDSIRTINHMDFSWGPTFGEYFPFIYGLINNTKMKNEYNTNNEIIKYRIKNEILGRFNNLFNTYIDDKDEISFMVGLENLLEEYFSEEQKGETDRIKLNIYAYIIDTKNQNKIKYYKELIKKNIDKIRAMHNKVDWIVSSYCFIHLVDPLGMFKQGFDILRPKHGIMTIDDLAVSINDDNVESGIDINYSKEVNKTNLVTCLLKSGEPFIVSRGRDFWNVMIKRSTETSLYLPVKYKDNGAYAKVRHTEGGIIAAYEWTDPSPLPFTVRTYLKEPSGIYSETISGSSKKFYDEYQDVFFPDVIKWTSINNSEDADDLLNFRFIEPMTAEEDYLTIKESEWNRVVLPYKAGQFEGILPSQNFMKDLIFPYDNYFNFRYANALSQKNYKEIIFILDEIITLAESKESEIKRKLHYFQKEISKKLEELEMMHEDSDHALFSELQEKLHVQIGILHQEVEKTEINRTMYEQHEFENDYETKIFSTINQINFILRKYNSEQLKWDNIKIELSALFTELNVYKSRNQGKTENIKQINDLKKEYQAILKLGKYRQTKE